MPAKVITIKAGLGHVYLVKCNNGAFIVDSGNKGYENKILTQLKANSVDIKALKFIFITHAHYDHAGSAVELEKLTGAPVIIQKEEAFFLQQGYQPLPKGTSAFFKGLISVGRLAGKTFSGFPPVNPSITFDSEIDLKPEFDIDGKIIHTPGHTAGSSTLIVDNIAFAGDTVFNIWNGTIYPIFADDENLLKGSWNKILYENVRYIYPAHGNRLSYRVFYKEAIRKGIA